MPQPVDDIKQRISDLSPEKTDIASALNFLRLVVTNNPKKDAKFFNSRSDVKSALKVYDDWYSEVSDIAKDIVNLIPQNMSKTIFDSTTKTLNGIKSDLSITDSNLDKWRSANSAEDKGKWGANIVLRMKFLLDWLSSQAGNLTVSGKYKTWVSRLGPNTCSYCRKLHGTTIPVEDSFDKAAKDAGWKRVYGGLFGPALHPSCKCTLRESKTK